ncbi:hypothetical protein [Leifsonia shinshuensis]|uniref:hypothetical protein n=1 Tax=Leifsonia shinshuensis TaxID=150026 RepID=UPI001627D66B|nr:hypothetical protein [Leifsonia shinshuensis]
MKNPASPPRPAVRAVSRPSRRAVAATAAWSLPAVALTVASPAYAASQSPVLHIAGLPPTVTSGSSVTGAEVVAHGNERETITVELSAGFAWADGTASPGRAIGIGPGVHTIPPFTATTGVPGTPTGVRAESAGVRAWAPIEIGAGLYELTVLGAIGIICRGPDEFRADLAVIVPRGVRPARMEYRFFVTAATEGINMPLRLVSDDIRRSIDENYAIVHVQDLGDGLERLYLSCRGDAHTENVASAMYGWPIRATWPDGTQSVAEFPVLQQQTGSDGRPVAINAWDRTTWLLPGYDSTLSSQAAWGNVVTADTTGTLDGNHFHVDALASGRTAAEGNDETAALFYQFRHVDGTPASVTPTPRHVVIPSHSAALSVQGLLLGAPEQLGRAFTLDKPGYWRLLIWPQSSNSRADLDVSPDGVAWDPATDQGHQVGSVFWKLPATAVREAEPAMPAA